MITKELVDRINELAKKAKTVGLTEEETEERQRLREMYLAAFRENLKAQLDNIRFVEDMTEDMKDVEESVEEAEEELKGAIEDIAEAEARIEAKLN